MSYRIALNDMPVSHPLTVVVVGCGGTGGFVVEGLCRLLPEEQDLLLIDHDRVEPHNLLRQSFVEGDVGRFKSQALAERLSREYRRKVGYSVLPYTRDLLAGSELGTHFRRKVLTNCLIIGCVDNAPARQEIRQSCTMGNWWLDVGNSHHSGQVLLGNTEDLMFLAKSFHPDTHEVHALPSPSLQLPGLLVPAPAPKRDCAQAVEAEEQSPVINQAMSVLVLEMVRRILRRDLTYMGMYLDLDIGSLHTVPAEPETVARICGVNADTLTDFGCGHGGELIPRHMRRVRR